MGSSGVAHPTWTDFRANPGVRTTQVPADQWAQKAGHPTEIETGRGHLPAYSHDEHGVAEAVEAVALGGGAGVGMVDQLFAGEGADQHEQRGAR